MYFGYHQYQLYFDFPGLIILLAIFICLALLVFLVSRRKSFAVGAIAGLLVALSAVQFYRGAMVPDSAWVVMLGAIENTTGADHTRLVEDLCLHWNARTMRAFDWYFLSRKWNVCHSLWPQVGCLTPVASEQAVGLAREKLNNIAMSHSLHTARK